MNLHAPVSRRTILRGLGTAVTLPFLESLLPRTLATPASAPVHPRRLAFMYVPNGIHMPAWMPTTEGADFQIQPILEPMRAFKDDMIMFGGLTCDKARANGDGGGDHARASTAFLTNIQPFKTAGLNLHAGVSADQVAAARLGNQTRLPSLELAVERFRGVGNCDNGYSCVYEHTLAWRNATLPLPTEGDPRLVFNRMFAERPNDPTLVARNRERGSVLDAVLGEANSLDTRLGGNDRQKLEQYLTTVRELEQRIGRADMLPPVQIPDGVSPPRNIPADLTEHIRTLADLMTLAFQTDSTRIITFMFGREGSEQQYRMLDVSGSHHLISHHQNRQENFDKLTKINRYHIQQLAYFVANLKAIPEGDGTLLDNCMIVYGSAISDGNSHQHHNLPVLTVGKGGGTLRTGRFVNYRRETPLANLWLALLERFGAPIDAIGDSNGVLDNLS